MKKKIVALLVATSMVASMGISTFVFAEEAAEETAEEAVEEEAEEEAEAEEAEAEEEAEAAEEAAPAGGATEADLPTEPEFDPNEDYDMWTVVEYTIEDIQADLVCTVSAKADFSEFYLECNFYGDDQMTRTTYDGETYEVLEDKTGFMGGDTPAVLDKAQEQDIWIYFDGAAAEGDAAEGGATEADLPTEPEFDPNPDYAVYTVVEYTIEDIQADLVCTVSANEDFTEFYLECNFYGDDQMTRSTKDGDTYEILEDKTGFMGGDTPAILDKALEQHIWVPIA